MRVDAYASEAHFADHIAPVWAALDPEIRGEFLVERHLLRHAQELVEGARPATSTLLRAPRDRPVIVAAVGDNRRVKRRPAIYMEHGAGQTYLGGHHSYAGGAVRENVRLFLNPSARVAELNRRAWPGAAQAIVGCPRLDRYAGRKWPRHDPPTIALTWHWNCRVVPETVGAFDYYRPALEQLVGTNRYRLLGHGHPRLFEEPELERTYRALGIPIIRDFAEILEDADVLAADNTSAMFEFAATDRPVVVMNAPWYRRGVEHGGRFWEWAEVGVQVEHPDGLEAGIEAALEDAKPTQKARRRVSAAVYAFADGTASRRAADAIAEWVATGTRRAAA